MGGRRRLGTGWKTAPTGGPRAPMIKKKRKKEREEREWKKERRGSGLG